MSHMALRRIEVACVTVATTVASGSFKGIDNRLSEIVGIPIDKLGIAADIGAGALAFNHWRTHRKLKGVHMAFERGDIHEARHGGGTTEDYEVLLDEERERELEQDRYEAEQDALADYLFDREGDR